MVFRDKRQLVHSPGMADFKKLRVWEKAHALMLAVYGVAKSIRRTYDVSLRSQMNRAALSIPTNIVEGRRQASDPEFARFLRIAPNSGFELEYHLIAARDIGAITERDSDFLTCQVIEVRRMLHGLLRRLGELWW
jgi:four helix bundle protein